MCAMILLGEPSTISCVKTLNEWFWLSGSWFRPFISLFEICRPNFFQFRVQFTASFFFNQHKREEGALLICSLSLSIVYKTMASPLYCKHENVSTRYCDDMTTADNDIKWSNAFLWCFYLVLQWRLSLGLPNMADAVNTPSTICPFTSHTASPQREGHLKVNTLNAHHRSPAIWIIFKYVKEHIANHPLGELDAGVGEKAFGAFSVCFIGRGRLEGKVVGVCMRMYVW